MKPEEWISATEARTRLGVRAQTLYAYVSRGHVQVRVHPDDSRRSLYRALDVDALAARQGRSRKLADVASAAIAWGEPVLASAITTVRDGRLYYRGRDAARLADDHTLEQVAGLLLGGDDHARPDAPRPPPSDHADVRHRLFHALADRVATAPPMPGARAAMVAAEAALLLDIVADAASGLCGDGPIHQRLATGWGQAATGPAADLIRRMLVLVADHELNASTFAARVTAATGASLAASVLAGLSALSGPRHGGQSAVVRRFLAEAKMHGTEEAARGRLIEDRHLPGFGHPLYPLGDIRARALLDRFEVPRPLAELQAMARLLCDAEPNIDFAMIAACDALGLPEDAPFAIFATARCAGWIAHAVEQGESRTLIRPRARYVGPEPLAP
ncbi:citrate synthase [Sphingobium sufflavum]|uniref:citrate synthase n=1 Tax=Sphingobium sufflavum TaxID=1129547 RepID=UPI001F2034FC|nr:citrate synthase [Sphingobium sufflavum]MCE7795426.1 citrate synthase [Sphingobium sufflavum]